MKLFHVALPTIAMLIASMPTLATPPLPQKSISKPAVKSLTTLFRNDAPLLRSTDPGAERFRAIGQLKADLTCTAELIAGADEPAADRQALILTAGHCVDKAMGPNEVRIDQPAGTGWRFTPAFFIDTQSQHRSFEVDRVMFGTMKKADIAILRLKASYGDMRALGVKPLHVMSAPSYPDMPIELVHVPVEGVPETEQFLRHSVCHADGETAIFEDWTPWYWRPAVPNDCVGVAPGTSGAPVVQMGDSRVIGVLNTTVDRHLTGCGLSRPCEWTDDGSIGVREGASYFIPVGTVAEALRPDSTFDTKRLDPGDGVVLRRSKGWSTQSQIVGDDGTRQPATWMLRIDPEFEWIRYKTGPANTTTCDSDGYGAQLKAADQPLLHLRTPSQEGITMMCVIGKRFGFTPWQQPQYATVMLRQIDDTPPRIPLTHHVTDGENQWDVWAYPHFNEIINVMVKNGPLDKTRCDDENGYRRYLVPIGVGKEKGPWRVCLYGMDEADNRTTPTIIDLNEASAKATK